MVLSEDWVGQMVHLRVQNPPPRRGWRQRVEQLTWIPIRNPSVSLSSQESEERLSPLLQHVPSSSLFLHGLGFGTK